MYISMTFLALKMSFLHCFTVKTVKIMCNKIKMKHCSDHNEKLLSDNVFTHVEDFFSALM